jgi:tetratricopeptide (TPR) repeat protein
LGWLAALIAVQAVGLFSKESAAVLPGLMLLFDLTWPERSLLRARARAYAALAIPFAAFFYLRSMTHAHLEIIPSENPLVNADFWTARLTAFKVIGKLLGLFLWPAHLSADYSYNAVPLFGWRMSNWEDAKALLSVAVCVGAVVVAFLWRRTRPLFFFTGFFFVALAPTANVIILIGSIMAERFMYLPSVGLAGCVAVALGALNRRFAVTRPLAAQVTWIAVGAASLALAARTYARNFDWHDERSLWTSTVAVCPDVARAHMNLGHALAQKREGLPQAIAEYRTALRILPDYAQAHYNLGIALAQEGKLPEAIVEYEATLRIQPESADAHNNLGIALSQTAGRMPDAIAEWKTTLRFQPDHAIAHYNLGNALSQTPGGIEDAVAEWQAALRTQPDLADVHYNLGNYYSNIPGRASEAIAEYEAAVLIQPDFAEAHNNLANALARVPGRLQDAITHWKAAVRTRPDLAEAHYNLGNALSQFPGRLPEAIAELETGLRIKPSPEMQQTLDRLRAQH